MSYQNQLKNLNNVDCEICEKPFIKKTKSKCCSTECKLEYKKRSKEIRRQKENAENYEKNKNLIGAVVCQICGFKSHRLYNHVHLLHHITTEEYKNKFPNSPLQSESHTQQQSERILGDKNPAYQHGGKYSPYSEKFIKGKDKNIHKKCQETKIKNNTDPTKLSYYASKGMSEEEAKIALSKRQTTFSLEKCIEKYGLEAGTKRWQNRQKKWLKNNKKSNFSKISQCLFWKIFSQLTVKQRSRCFFATLDENKNRDDSGKNFEKVIETFRVDFILDQKIIEFDGDYGHSDAWLAKNNNLTRDNIRQEKLEKLGYQVLRIREHKYKDNPQETINECICFLNK